MTEDLPDVRFSIERLRRDRDLRALLGWRYAVVIYAYDDTERRWRPAPLVLYGALYGWRARARSAEKAGAVGRYLSERLLTRHREELERRANITWSDSHG